MVSERFEVSIALLFLNAGFKSCKFSLNAKNVLGNCLPLCQNGLYSGELLCLLLNSAKFNIQKEKLRRHDSSSCLADRFQANSQGSQRFAYCGLSGCQFLVV